MHRGGTEAAIGGHLAGEAIVLLDTAAVHALNRIDPAITLATLALTGNLQPWHIIALSMVMGVLIACNAKFFDTEMLAAVPPDPTAGLRLLLISAVLLTSPKWLAIILWAAGKLPSWDRSPRFLVAVACDLGMTALTAPIIMVNHAGSILSTLMGVDGGWRPQVRDRIGFSWSDLVRHYQQHMIFGMLLLVASFAVSPSFLLQNLRRDDDGWTWQPNLAVLGRDIDDTVKNKQGGLDPADNGAVDIHGPRAGPVNGHRNRGRHHVGKILCPHPAGSNRAGQQKQQHQKQQKC